MGSLWPTYNSLVTAMVVGRRNEVTSGTILECRVERWLPNQVAQSPDVFTQGAMTRGP